MIWFILPFAFFLSIQCLAPVISNPSLTHSYVQPRSSLQDLVKWDEHSVFVRGERMMFLSGEFHPFRLPSPGLWLDIFQKIKAMGYNGVSFYTDWGLLERRTWQRRHKRSLRPG